MRALSGTSSTGRGARSWPVLGVTVVAVALPAALVLFFMAAAVRNERLAVKERLSAAYRAHLESCTAGLEGFWNARADVLSSARDIAPPEAFRHLVTSGIASSVVMYAEDGTLAYPVPRGEAAAPAWDSPAWRAAAEFEYGEGDPGAAAQAYMELARLAQGPDERAVATNAAARCLAHAGRSEQAIGLLTGEARSADTAERLPPPAPDSLLFALEIMGADHEKFDATARELAALLSDYSSTPMPSARRVFLMQRLCGLAPKVAHFPTLEAEEIALAYLGRAVAPTPPRELHAAFNTGDTAVLQYDIGAAVALFKAGEIESALRDAAGIADPPEGTQIALRGPGEPARSDAFVSMTAPQSMPGWTLDLSLVGENPFDEAAQRQIAVYLFAGVLGVSAIVLFGGLAAHYVTRQMRLARLKNDLVATVSHELKTPLSSMRVLVETLLEGRSTGRAQEREYLQLIERENRRLSRLIDNFLAFSRMERNRRAFDFAPVDIGDVVEEALAPVRERCSPPECQLSVEAPDDLPAVRADRDALVSVLVNLLDNAYKYSGDAKEISLKVYREGRFVRLAVADNGVGLTKRRAKRIFERFYQVDRSLSREAGGCGLGLAIVKFIIDAHGGDVEVSSRPGEGSTFTVSVPVEGREGRE